MTTRPAPRLRTRIILYFLVLVVVWTLFVVLLLGDLLGRSSRDQFRDRGAQIARLLAVEAAPLVHYGDSASLSELLVRGTHSPEEIRYIIVLRDDGRVMASTFEDGIPRSLLRVAHTESLGPDVQVQLVETAREQLYDYEASRMGVRVRLGMSLQPVQRFAYEVTSYVLWIGVAALLGVFAIALHVSRPVEALMKAVARAAELEPDLDKAHEVLYGTAETSALATWFRDMVNRLRESAKRLEKSQKLAYLGEVSTSIAHEINNPLGILVLNSEFLAKRVENGEIPAPAAAEVERVRTAAMRATLAAQKLLQFARYSTQSGPLKRHPVKPATLIRETVDLLSDEIRLAGCTVRIDVQPDLRKVPLDVQGIQQVVFNLLTNALDASAEGGEVVIHLTIDHDSLRLSVEDHGQGMSEELLERAKEPFFTTKEGRTGTGLGLAITESIVRSHGGELLIASREGEGTTVTICLPLGHSP